jgi:hypothetical protein
VTKLSGPSMIGLFLETQLISLSLKMRENISNGLKRVKSLQAGMSMKRCKRKSRRNLRIIKTTMIS